MVWVNSPKLFCVFSETLMDVANAIINTSLLVPGYYATTKISNTRLGLPLNLYRPTHIECYMDEAITLVQE